MTDWQSLAAAPLAAAGFQHLVLVDPPSGAERERAALRSSGAGFAHRCWGSSAELAELLLGRRVGPPRPARRRSTGRCVAGRAERRAAAQARSSAPAATAAPPGGGGALRSGSSASSGSCRAADGGDARSLRVVSSERTELERSAAFRRLFARPIRRARNTCRAEERSPDGHWSRRRGVAVDPALDESGRIRVGVDEGPAAPAPVDSITRDLTDRERELLGDLLAVIGEHDSGNGDAVDQQEVERAFEFACERHADQLRHSGDEFITHPVGVAQICAGMRLDTETLCAALLHDTVEDTSASLDEIRDEFGEEIAQLVDGVTKLTGITFESRDERQAENYRKMMVAMATDVRVILIKLADRLHNMRTLGALPKQKQLAKARETLEIYAPLAHRLGIHAIKWELEDLAFATLHPRKYDEIKQLVAQQRDERERLRRRRRASSSPRSWRQVGIEAEISGRAKHFYSIYTKMTKKGREFNEIFDLTAMRVIVGSVKDCYGAIGVIHSLWKPLPGPLQGLRRDARRRTCTRRCTRR